MSSCCNKKVFVAMSGGVDSSVAAALLKKQGYEVVGVHMKCWSEGSPSTRPEYNRRASLRAISDCSSEIEDARRAAEVLGIPFYVLDLEKEYKEKVVEYMIDGYRQGITPNPDVMCNKEIKFGIFLKKALEMGADFVATGHYVRLCRTATSDKRQATSDQKKIGQMSHVKCQMFSARDAQKDQSYFLWTLTQNQLRHCLFPIGDYLKPEVRRMARQFGLPNAEKKDSQGICFLGQVTLKDFLGNYLPAKKGLVLNTAGKIVGEHSGAHFYTIGQRHTGVNLRPTTNDQQPLYIAEKDVEENAILVAEENDPMLYRKEIALTNVNFLTPHIRTNMGYKVFVRIRYRQPLVKATLFFEKNPRQSALAPNKVEGLQSASIRVLFEKPQKAVASGQSAVFYEYKGNPSTHSTGSGQASLGLMMLGGGIIEQARLLP